MTFARPTRPSAHRLLVLVLQLAVLATVVGGTAAFVRFDKTVTVTLDGQPRPVRTYARTVGGVLDQAGLAVGEHDTVAPDLTDKVPNHGAIVVRRGRPLSVTVNRQARQVWVTATSVSEALDQLGLARPGVWVSASRSRPIGLAGASFDVRIPQRVEVIADGHATSLTTAAPTVGEALADGHITVGSQDILSVPAGSYPTDGMIVRITRVNDQQVVESQVVPRTTTQVQDSSLYSGQTRVRDDGQDGVMQLVYTVHLVNGQPAGRTLSSQTLTAPMRPRVVAVGTGTPPPAATPSYPSSGHGLNWAALANCESGGNPRAVSPDGTYRGLYQFSFSTWQSVGGSGDPINASSSEQTYRAQILYNSSGRGAWPVCGQYL